MGSRRALLSVFVFVSVFLSTGILACFAKASPRTVSACFLKAIDGGEIFRSFDSTAITKACCPECDKESIDYPRNANSAINTQWVTACGLKASLGKRVRVSSPLKALCERKPHWFDRFVELGRNYVLTRKDDGVHLDLKVRLRIYPADTSPERGDFMLDRARACIPKIKELYARSGLKLGLQFDSDRAKVFWFPDIQSIVSDEKLGVRRSDAGTLYFWAQNNTRTSTCFNACLESRSWDRCEKFCEDPRQEDFCLIVVHEMGHWLGLADEYADPSACPDRVLAKEQFPMSVMNEQSKGWHLIDLMPRHVKTLVEPLCR